MWRENMGALFEIEAPPTVPGQGRHGLGDFEGRLVGYNCGPLLFGHTRTQAQRFARSPGKIARDGLDHFLLQSFLTADGPTATSRRESGLATST